MSLSPSSWQIEFNKNMALTPARFSLQCLNKPKGIFTLQMLFILNFGLLNKNYHLKIEICALYSYLTLYG